MNNVIKGRTRSQNILNLIDQGKAFTRSQIQSLFFPFPTGKRKCLEVLHRLEENKAIKKHYKGLSNSCSVYYVDRKPVNLNHILSINDVYVALQQQKKPWQVVEWKWEYQIMNGMVQTDAYVNWYTKPDRQGRIVFFLEMECDLRKKFNKDTQYTKVFNEDWVNEEWVVIDGNKAIFPTILIVTEHKPEIKENPNNIRFVIATPEQVQKDIYSLVRR